MTTTELAIWAGGIVVLFIIVILLFKAMWRVAEPNEALIISGLGAHTKNELARTAWASRSSPARARSCCPGVQTVRRLSLDLPRGPTCQSSCVTHQGIPAAASAAWSSTRSATTSPRSPTRPAASSTSRTRWSGAVHNVFTGHLRAIVGNMTVEEMIRDREKLTGETRSSRPAARWRSSA